MKTLFINAVQNVPIAAVSAVKGTLFHVKPSMVSMFRAVIVYRE